MEMRKSIDEDLAKVRKYQKERVPDEKVVNELVKSLSAKREAIKGTTTEQEDLRRAIDSRIVKLRN